MVKVATLGHKGFGRRVTAETEKRRRQAGRIDKTKRRMALSGKLDIKLDIIVMVLLHRLVGNTVVEGRVN